MWARCYLIKGRVLVSLPLTPGLRARGPARPSLRRSRTSYSAFLVSTTSDRHLHHRPSANRRLPRIPCSTAAGVTFTDPQADQHGQVWGPSPDTASVCLSATLSPPSVQETGTGSQIPGKQPIPVFPLTSQAESQNLLCVLVAFLTQPVDYRDEGTSYVHVSVFSTLCPGWRAVCRAVAVEGAPSRPLSQAEWPLVVSSPPLPTYTFG